MPSPPFSLELLVFFPGCNISFSEDTKGNPLLPQALLAPWRPCLCLVLMLKTRPLRTRAESKLGDRVLGEVEKNSFIALPGKGGHSGLVPLKTVSQPGRIC